MGFQISGFETGSGWTGGAFNTADVFEGSQSYSLTPEVQAQLTLDPFPGNDWSKATTGETIMTCRLFILLGAGSQGQTFVFLDLLIQDVFLNANVSQTPQIPEVILPGVNDAQWWTMTWNLANLLAPEILQVVGYLGITVKNASSFYGNTEFRIDDLRLGPARSYGSIEERIIQVLKDFLPVELDLIDTEEADGITTPDIDAADYYAWSQKTIPSFPACTVHPVTRTPIEARPTSFGERTDDTHKINVMFHVSIGRGVDATTCQALLLRYIAGAVRVLCVMKESLQTMVDHERFAEIVTWSGDAVYGPEAEQDDGAIVRSALLPIEVRRREER